MDMCKDDMMFVQILREELIPSMGCTEPNSLAFAAAKAREVLGEQPLHARAEVSGNIIKNVKSVVVPHTGGMRGIASAVAAGIAIGQADQGLQVLAQATEKDVAAIEAVKASCPVEVVFAESDEIFDVAITLEGAEHTSYVRIVRDHTNIVCIKRDGAVLFENVLLAPQDRTDRSGLTVERIVEFAQRVPVEAVRDILDRQIAYNMAIAEEGIANNYGANIGKTFLHGYQPDIKIKAKAYAAAGSDARMNGCELPVIINSGSGNQGITASVPVIVYARALQSTPEELYRALCISNLITIHLKTGIGTLSAYCGVVSAGTGAGCGIAYLLGGRLREISHTIVNSLAVDSGIICDGAKASCAAKIAVAVESGIMGFEMYCRGNQFCDGEGIVKKGVENTIANVSRLACEGMRETDNTIVHMMVE